jgi:hypothetical protein
MVTAMTAASWRTTTVRASSARLNRGTISGQADVSRTAEDGGASVWNPKDIRDSAVQQKVLAHMQAAERGFRRLDAALDRIGPEALTQILSSLKLQSIDRVDNLKILRQIALALEAVAQERAVKQ